MEKVHSPLSLRSKLCRDVYIYNINDPKARKSIGGAICSYAYINI